MKIPHGQGVARALRGVRVATKKALKGLNQAAAKRMGRGDYAGAEALVAKAREIGRFEQQTNELLQVWRQLSGRGPKGATPVKGEATPLWAYYQPILKAILRAGGDCTRTDIEEALERSSDSFLTPGDRGPMPSGRERWKAMIRRARKPLKAEGWIHDGPGSRWRITEAGRRAAERAPTTSPQNPQL